MSRVAAAPALVASQGPTGPIPVAGLFETHLTVSDLGRSVAFYREVVGLPLALELPERGAALLWIGGPGEGMLGLWSLGSAPLGLTLHVAFKASADDVLGACERLRSLSVTPLSFSAEETTEPTVLGWMPAAAVYFRDPDGHLLEYLAMLDAPPDPEAGVVSWSEWTAREGSLDSGPAGVSSERHPGPHAEPRTPTARAEGSVARLEAHRGAARGRRPPLLHDAGLPRPGRRLRGLAPLEPAARAASGGGDSAASQSPHSRRPQPGEALSATDRRNT